LIASVCGIAIVLVASLFPLFGRTAAPVVVGTESFDEQFTLGSLMQQRLSRAGFTTQRRDGLGTTVIFHALAASDVDVCVNYSGTIWANEMRRTDMPGRAEVMKQMTAWLAKTYGIRVLGSFGFEDAYAFAMRRDHADALHIDTVADLVPHAPGMKVGGDYEIFSRPEWRKVESVYGLRFAEQRQYQSNFMYRAVQSNDVDVITAFSSDGRIAQYNLKLLNDPKHAWPPYDAVLLISPKHAHDAKLIATLKPLIGAIDLKTMQRANLMVDRDVNKLSPEETARWLDSKIRH
jgi:osmoprotectant transport system permease protein